MNKGDILQKKTVSELLGNLGILLSETNIKLTEQIEKTVPGFLCNFSQFFHEGKIIDKYFLNPKQKLAINSLMYLMLNEEYETLTQVWFESLEGDTDHITEI